jgi:hypothetical protein
LIAASAPQAGAAVTIGQTFTPTGFWGDAGVFIQSASPGGIYTVPSDGVVTSWSFEASNVAPSPPLKLKIVRRVGGNDFLTVGDSELQTPVQGMLNTWPTRIPVRAGDVLAEYYTNDIRSYRSGVDPAFVTNEISGSPGDPAVDPPPGTTATYESDDPEKQIDAAATVEPDADRDGFGDETQDRCPTSASTAGTCPVKKKCKKKHKKKHRSAEAAKKKKCKKKKHR